MAITHLIGNLMWIIPCLIGLYFCFKWQCRETLLSIFGLLVGALMFGYIYLIDILLK